MSRTRPFTTSLPSRRRWLALSGAAIGAVFLGLPRRRVFAAGAAFEVQHSDAEWRQLLTPAQYAVLREEGTERPFSSPLDHEKRNGVFACAGCGSDVFDAKTKFDSRTGWPSFWKPLPRAVAETHDTSLGMQRTEIHCRRCGGHFGHVFDDGPPPTHLRYCMNGVAMTFKAV